MKFTLENNTKDSIINLMRSLGYKFLSRENEQMSFIKQLDRSFYPRFHVYLKEENNLIYYNLHLDQKKPRYQGQTAHNADYDGEVVGKEAKRIKSFFL